MSRLLRIARRMVPRGTKFRPSRDHYDYIIVGAGSAGCVLANELSANKSCRVLLVEAGGWDWKPLIHIPAGVYSVFKDPSLNWNMESEPEADAAGRRIELPRGKVVGGSSAINACVYMRGHPRDYDMWAERYALPSWRFDNCLPYFKRCETFDGGGDDFRGDAGRLMVSHGNMLNPMFDALLEAGKQSGQGVSDDLNGYKPEGVARLDRTTSPDGGRCSAADAHLIPALERSNLELVTQANVQQVVIHGNRATGITLDDSTHIHAANEVILCAGAIKSPQLLMLSGIGPREQLSDYSIPCQQHLPGVGQNLMDHACINIAFHAAERTRRHSLAHLSNPLGKAKAGLQWLMNGNGPASSNIWEGGGLVYGQHGGFDPHADESIAAPNLQYHFCPVYASYSGRDIDLFPGFQMQIDQLRPHSRGQVQLRSSHSAVHPAVRFNYLSDAHDMAELVDGYKTALDLFAQPAFDAFRGTIALPSHRLRTDAEIEQFVRTTSGTDYHPCGTCRMGGNESDDKAVVDEELRVRGISGLRVVDASVMPSIVSGNLNAPTQMIAMKAADLILGRQPLASERPSFHFD